MTRAARDIFGSNPEVLRRRRDAQRSAATEASASQLLRRFHMPTSMVRAALAGLAIALVPLANANAHCFVGGRFFPAMLATDDPCVADEMSLPTAQYNSANPSGREHDIGADFSKRITENFGITVSSTWTRVRPPADTGTNGPSAYGFQNLVTTAQFPLLKDGPGELPLLARAP